MNCSSFPSKSEAQETWLEILEMPKEIWNSRATPSNCKSSRKRRLRCEFDASIDGVKRKIQMFTIQTLGRRIPLF